MCEKIFLVTCENILQWAYSVEALGNYLLFKMKIKLFITLSLTGIKTAHEQFSAGKTNLLFWQYKSCRLFRGTTRYLAKFMDEERAVFMTFLCFYVILSKDKSNVINLCIIINFYLAAPLLGYWCYFIRFKPFNNFIV